MGHANLRIEKIHIRNLRAIRSLELPEQGLGWGGKFPDFAILGGVNGSGKTTLMECITTAVKTLYQEFNDAVFNFPDYKNFEVMIEFEAAYSTKVPARFRYLIGNEAFVNEFRNDGCFGHELIDPVYFRPFDGPLVREFRSILQHPDSKSHADFPCLDYWPSESRALLIPLEQYKMPGELTPNHEFARRWRAPDDWKTSLEARLYSARWEDLNAREEGRDDDSRHFEAYNHEFERFFNGRKRMKWDHGKLVIELKNGSTHGLGELSSGEKQVVLLMGEILTRWRPGSLILIDEPELHLHPSWQTKLWEALTHWRNQRGGQVIITTQSSHLFQVSEPRTKALLGGEALA